MANDWLPLFWQHNQYTFIVLFNVEYEKFPQFGYLLISTILRKRVVP